MNRSISSLIRGVAPCLRSVDHVLAPPDEVALALVGRDEALVDKRRDCMAHRHASDAVLVLKLLLRRQQLPRPQLARRDQPAEVVRRSAGRPAVRS